MPIQVSAVDAAGQPFNEEARTLLLSRHGAAIVLKRRLASEQEIRIRRLSTGKEAAFRVVGQIGGEDESYVYGVAILDASVNLWGIEFPPLAESERAVGRLLMECLACQNREVVYMNELEVQVFQANESLSRPCNRCARSSLWRGAFYEVPAGTALNSGEPAALPEALSLPTEFTAGKRRHPRLNFRLSACVRHPGFGEELVATVNVSRGGFCFFSPKAYLPGSLVEAAVPYLLVGGNVFVPARVAYVMEAPTQGLKRVGVGYAQPDQGLSKG